MWLQLRESMENVFAVDFDNIVQSLNLPSFYLFLSILWWQSCITDEPINSLAVKWLALLGSQVQG